MCKLFDDWSENIKEYCIKNNLSFEKAKSLSQSYNKTTVALYYCDKELGGDGLLSDIPSPMVLLIHRGKDGELHFEQTEYTKHYLM